MRVNVLGTDYEIVVKKYDEDEAFARRHIDGYCDSYTKIICVCDMTTFKGWEHEEKDTCIEAQKQTIRHEITHAFLYESGIDCNSHICEEAWAKNEEMVDWIAIQGEKIYKAWKEADCL